ncbi:hypothetical protein BDB00DRAFT_855295 [Zychaea mexicana]|uniref:uncharacterized protein n=1 Tax=Zychaea mexicana TaxID=64656 RepID=UPI0022FDC7E0|nr:uncharacterized protein BDB00DRAFT_855295 [Zychaea mexicana]KAI9484519.1 hypothetical protein BDB00DRAFT_855295 [Zychaea mexicana]
MRALTTLPLEIRYAILRHLSFGDRWRMSGVCQAWRSAVLNCDAMWENLSTDNYRDITQDLLPYRSYMQGTWVRRIHVDRNDDTTEHLEAVVDFLLAQKCTAIKEVDLHLQLCHGHPFQVSHHSAVNR